MGISIVLSALFHPSLQFFVFFCIYVCIQTKGRVYVYVIQYEPSRCTIDKYIKKFQLPKSHEKLTFPIQPARNSLSRTTQIFIIKATVQKGKTDFKSQGTQRGTQITDNHKA